MNRTLTPLIGTAERKAAYILTLLVLAFVVLTLTQDILRSDMKHSAFYFSESFMFSSFWWLFAPLIFTQYLVVRQNITKQLSFHITIVLLPIIVHLFAFPFLVWTISGIFYYHTFSFQQTFRFTLSEHLYLLVLFYSIPVLAFQFLKKTQNLAEPVHGTQNEGIGNTFINTVVVSDGYKKHSIIVSDILYFSANPPYININLESRKYLHNETLKSISLTLNPEQFVRVHKSTIVNIKMVDSYTTRLNGDYDLAMKNNVTLRLSRNFAKDFKNRFNKTHHLTTN